MRHKEKLLYVNHEAYDNLVSIIYTHANRLIEASQEMESLKLIGVKPENLIDGKFVERVIAFYKKEWSNNEAFKHVSFKKYLDFIEFNAVKLKALENQYNSMKNMTFSFYPKNNEFFSICEHRYKDGLEDAGKKIELKMNELFKIKGNDIQVNLDMEYYKLYSTNAGQLKKIKEIEAFIITAKNIKADYHTVKKMIGNWITDLSYDLGSFKINYYYLLRSIN
jgi:hypothetical protein